MTRTLETFNEQISLTASQFSSYDRIVTYDLAANLNDSVSLEIASSGTVDLSLQLEGVRAVVIYASADGNTVTAGDKDDILYGGSASDILNGGKGNDTLYSSTTLSSEVDTLNGGDGDDTFHSGTNTRLNGGQGRDLWIASGDVSRVSISSIEVLATGFSTTITLTVEQLSDLEWLGAIPLADWETYGSNVRLSGAGSVDLTKALGGIRPVNIHASSAGNTITAGDQNDQLYGNMGADVLNGGGGDDAIEDDSFGAYNDILNGDTGNDEITSWNGNDTLNGGAGDDYLMLDVTNGRASTVIGGTGWDTLFAYGNMSNLSITGVEAVETNGDTITATAAQFSSFERIITWSIGKTETVSVIVSGSGSIDFSDALEGERGIHVTTSAVGNTVTGGTKADTFAGGKGVDRFYGGDGDDILDGGTGKDMLNGGAGNDTYVLGAESDTVSDSAG
ncbi:hypothetical protein IFT66_07055, partial [Rhizobium sp. CFBP 13726]|uniref:calcium-binding protein n=1 Tax=Rhizobium sp. CFBP 13726 TaxID=2775296 RepID=UPI00198DB33C|nr:hypothetical protein [Rhizobium sp. CFBP 13726]